MHPRLSICGLLSVPALLLASAHAQTHRVEAPEKVTRAVGVYEWTGDLAKPTASRLIPVSLFINGHFEDAGVFLARPVPFVLETGNVYAIERAGVSIGTFDLDYARNLSTRRSAGDADPLGAWFGYGRFVTLAEEAKANKLHASKPPVVIASTDADAGNDKPQFVRRQPTTTGSTPSPKPDSAAKPVPTTTAPAPDDDPDRPTLRHRDPADANKTKKKNTKELGYVTAPNTSLNEDPDRPSLHRGIPAEQAAPSQLAGTPANLHQAVAVSDAATHDPHPFAREWATPTERAQTLTDLEALAQPRLAAYLAANKLTPAPPANPAATPAPGPSAGPTSKTAAPVTHPTFTATPRMTTHTIHPIRSNARKSVAPPPPPLSLDNEQLSGYALSYGGLPTFLYTVEAPVQNGGPVYLTLVAQRLPSGELQVALSSVTDATHLDRTPWLRPIDVVDPDWSHRANVLFELRAQSSRQFALYRLITAQAEQTFITGLIQ